MWSNQVVGGIVLEGQLPAKALNFGVSNIAINFPHIEGKKCSFTAKLCTF